MKKNRKGKKKGQGSQIPAQQSHPKLDSMPDEEIVRLVADPCTGSLLTRASEPPVNKELIESYLHAQDAYIVALEKIVLSAARIPGKSSQLS